MFKKDSPEEIEQYAQQAAALIARLAAELGRRPKMDEYMKVYRQHGCKHPRYFLEHGINWKALAARAGIMPGSIEDELAEVRRRIQQQRETDRHWYEWGLDCIPTRKEERIVRLPNGEAMRIVSEYYSVR
jgi:hypothetical protein